MESKVRTFLNEKFSEYFPDVDDIQSLTLGSSGIDSLEFMEMVMELEDIIGRDLPESLIEDLDQTIEEFIKKIESI